MENASKALIIAGAILLAILIISLGIMVYNQAKSTVSDASLDSEEIQTINAKFSSYLGTQTGAKVNALMQAIIAEENNNTKVSITVNCYSSDYSAAENVTNAKLYTYTTTSTYTVTFEYADSGVLSVVNIS